MSNAEKAKKSGAASGGPNGVLNGFSLPFFRKRAAIYYDGFNLYHSVDAYKRPYLKWLDLKALAVALAPKSEVVKRVVWCSAFRPQSKSKLKRHEDYMNALKARGVTCRIGHFVSAIDGCNACGHQWHLAIEKQGDVNLALSIAADAEDNLFDVCYLVTADGDHAATARYFKERFPKKQLVLVCPPGRYPNKHIVPFVDRVMEIEREHLEASLLPQMTKHRTRFFGPHKLIERPEAYDPPELREKGHLKVVVNNG
ncbi:NYN domain-containing protein [Asticcacaulis sp. BYS171W]|uniref:NYN domain-containing protein n=1 Tax=Asticcacaulis aquaticus TaxID=2984212 RepID=A0ABT5HUN4_9CAUL|nr:NYN domain-containing protein [Asticcacaulis aquaticus]MDC7683785.1 NYN domain-containing protein [Asticcacaulis aquaticus]